MYIYAIRLCEKMVAFWIQVVYSTQNLHNVGQSERTCSLFAKLNFYIIYGTFKKTNQYHYRQFMTTN